MLRPRRIHHHSTIASQCLQPAHKVGFFTLKLLDFQTQHRRCTDASCTLFLQPRGQITGAEPEQLIAGKNRCVNRLVLQKMNPISGDTTTLEKSGYVKGRVDGAKAKRPFLCQHLRLQHPMTSQSGVATAHQQNRALWNVFESESLCQGIDNLTIATGCFTGRQSPCVREHEQQL